MAAAPGVLTQEASFPVAALGYVGLPTTLDLGGAVALQMDLGSNGSSTCTSTVTFTLQSYLGLAYTCSLAWTVTACARTFLDRLIVHGTNATMGLTLEHNGLTLRNITLEVPSAIVGNSRGCAAVRGTSNTALAEAAHCISLCSDCGAQSGAIATGCCA